MVFPERIIRIDVRAPAAIIDPPDVVKKIGDDKTVQMLEEIAKALCP